MGLESDRATCPGCGGSRFFSIRQWRVGKRHAACACQECGLIFVNPFPSPRLLQAVYAPGGKWNTTHGADVVPKKRQAARSLFAVLDRYFAASAPAAGSSVLDFGCGTGAWLNEFQDRGWSTYGIEPSTGLAFQRHRRLFSIPAEPQFSLVIAYHVLEHLVDPLDTLRALAEALRPGGHCFLSVPRLDGLAAHGKIRYCLQKHQHVVAFTEACLRGLLARAGMETLEVLHCLDRPGTPPYRLRLLARKASLTEPGPDTASALERVLQDLATLVTAER